MADPLAPEHPWPTAVEVELAHARPLDRRWSCFELEGCVHEPRLRLESGAGWLVEVCVTCGYPERSGCSHPVSEWNEAGTLLRCRACGMDGT